MDFASLSTLIALFCQIDLAGEPSRVMLACQRGKLALTKTVILAHAQLATQERLEINAKPMLGL